MDSMAAALPRNFCEITSALLHTQFFKYGKMPFLNFVPNLDLKKCHFKLSDPLEIRLGLPKRFRPRLHCPV